MPYEDFCGIDFGAEGPCLGERLALRALSGRKPWLNLPNIVFCKV